MIDKTSGQVNYAVLEFGGFLGMGTDRDPLPWSQLKYDTTQDGLWCRSEHLNDAPKYPSDKAPPYTTDYGRRVRQHYGIDD